MFLDAPIYHLPLQVRLAGGAHSYEGRLEVTRNGTWGTVCNSGFTRFDATVVCLQLGFDFVNDIYSSDVYGPGDESMPIYLRNPSCLGNEGSIGECDNALWGNYESFCSHQDDVALSCFGKLP